METFSREKNYYKDSLIVKHHQIKYSSKMPLWVIVELMSFSNMSKLYSSMYYSEKDAIAHMVGVGRDTLENHLHCLPVCGINVRMPPECIIQILILRQSLQHRF